MATLYQGNVPTMGRTADGPVIRTIQLSDLHDALRRGWEDFKAVPSHETRVVLDLAATSYLDSTGIAMIFRLGERLQYSRQQLLLVVPKQSPIRAVVELTDINHVIPVLDASVEASEPE